MTTKTTTTTTSVRLSALATIGAGLFGLTLEQALRAKPGVLDSIVNEHGTRAPQPPAAKAERPLATIETTDEDAPLAPANACTLDDFATTQNATA